MSIRKCKKQNRKAWQDGDWFYFFLDITKRRHKKFRRIAYSKAAYYEMSGIKK